MALFGRPDRLSSLLRKVRDDEVRGAGELASWLAQIGAHPDLEPRQIVWMAGHPRPEVRAFGERTLLGAGDPALVDLLLHEVEGRSEAIRREIAGLAVRIDPRRFFRKLGEMLHAPDVGPRLDALDLIAARSNLREVLGHLKAALRDPEPSIRRKAATILCTAPEDPAVKLILKSLLSDEDDAVRQRVIETLAEHADPDLVEPFLERLPFEAPRDQAHMTRALTRLAHRPSVKLADRLLPMLADENALVRDSAIRLLRQIPNRREVIRAYIHYRRGLACWLRDRSFKTFLCISDDILEPVLELMDDADPETRVGAMLLAAESDDPRIIPPVGRILESADDWWVRVVAVEALARLGTPEVLKMLARHLADPEVRFAVVAGLGRVGTRQTTPYLVPCLHDPQKQIRVVALDALREMRFPEVADAVARVALGDPEPEVAEKAVVVLEGLGAVGVERLRAVCEVRDREAREMGADVENSLEMENPRLAGRSLTFPP